jgi:hypothetical protein
MRTGRECNAVADFPEDDRKLIRLHNPAARIGRVPPRRCWRSDGDDPLPTGEEALNEPLRAFPSWILRVVCERCGDDTVFSETNSVRSNMLIRDIIARMRHDAPGCGGRAGRVELLTGIEGASCRPVRRIVLLGWPSA